MNVVITTPIWTGLRSFFLEANEESQGMPGFYEVFKRLATNDEIEHILLIVLDNPKSSVPLKLPEKFSKKVTSVKYSFNGTLSLAAVYFKAIFKICGYIRKNPNSVCFGHGYTAPIAGLASLITGVPNIRRIYGISNMIVNENWPKWKLLLFQPITYLSISLPVEWVIITNDGSHGDRIFQKIKGNTKKLVFKHNGVDRSIIPKKPKIPLPKEGTFLSYVGRIYDWKRQHLIVEAISKLAFKGIKIPCVFVGQIGDNKYKKRMEEMAENQGIKDLILIIPGLPVAETRYVMSKSLASLSFYETSNLGNVFLEGLTMGVPMIAENVNGSLNAIPSDCYINVLGHGSEDFYETLKATLENPEKLKNTGKNAQLFSEKNIPSWNTRAEVEMKLLKNLIK